MTRRWPLLACVAAAALVAGCDVQGVVDCGNGLACPLGFACDLAHVSCVLPEQLEACTDATDGTPCSFVGAPAATCVDGVCLPARCGNRIVDQGEACDDGNQSSGDGCPGDCLQLERCGDGVLQPGLGELCDDGALRDHDGCDSTCGGERPDWRPQPIADPGYRRNIAFGYDAHRRRAVLLGGASPAIVDETWEWDGAAWRQRDDLTGPTPRVLAAMTFDSLRGELVLFGGLIYGSLTSDETWTFDGAHWTLRAPASSPPPRFEATLAFDRRRGRVVMFGGYLNGQLRDDTWEWNGVTWIEVPVPVRPAPRHFGISAYDPASGLTLLLGGVDGAGTVLPNQPWTWNGSSWTLRTAAHEPTGRALSMAHDPTRNRIVLLTEEGDRVDEWLWDGTDWEHVATSLPRLDRNGTALFFDERAGRLAMYALVESTQELLMMQRMSSGWETPPRLEPPARDAAAMAYDSARGEAVTFGGLDLAGAPLGDLWSWRGEWIPLAPAGDQAPAPRAGHAMAFDAGRGEVVMVGGRTAAGQSGETWIWNGASWRLAGGMPPVEGLAVAYDAGRQRVVAFGGLSGSGPTAVTTSQTWEWDGAAWSERRIEGPPARQLHALAYDARRARVMMFGGTSDYGVFNDLWEYDGAAWSRLTPPAAPPARRGHVMTYNAARGTIVVMGGRSAPIGAGQPLADTWEWDGVTWRPVATFAAPTPRDRHASAYDVRAAEMIVFGGASSNQTWTFAYRGAGVTEVCGGGRDVDRDGLTDCADPDCWWMCTPGCPPGTSCDPAAPRCGDGVCSPVEPCRACAADCGTCAPSCGDRFCDPGEVCTGDC